jgi:hydrogenase/urease accessory protein HupE
MTSLTRKLLGVGIFMLSMLGVAWAHDPFDGATRMMVHPDRIEMKVTLGSDAARQFLRTTELPPQMVATLTRDGPSTLIDLPVAVARQLFEIRLGTEPLEAKTFVAQPGESETVFLAIYPRPPSGTLLLRATYFDGVKDMRTGAFAVGDEEGHLLVSALLSHANASIQLPLPVVNITTQRPESGTPVIQQSSFGEFLKLGIEHILTGFDHLLFLCALLVGVRQLRPMLAIITCFTLGHSVTLALAALNLVTISSRVVEPLIAVSIIIVGLENLFRKDATSDRYWMAGGFGLIHGFGFASALRSTGLGSTVSSIAMPLFSFNLGVETGQLLVALVVVPMFLLLRRKPVFAQYSTPAISVIVVAISSYWLLERTVFFR